ncbi:hypothetical protein FRC01_002471, partial [Tulasnella sp. 417]
QYHAAAVAFNPHAAPYGPAGGIQVGMIPPYGIGYPYGLVDPLRRPAFPPVPTTSVPPATSSSSAAEKKKQASGSEDASSSSQPKTIPGLASLTSPSYYPSPPDINESRRNGAGRKITPVTRDVPEDLADQRPDDLYEEVDVLDSSVAVVDTTSGDQLNIADPGSYPWATTVAGPSTFHGVPLTTKFRCKICDHIFPKKHTVVTHIKTHLGKKSYPCTFAGCAMAFVREHDRKRHQATHTGERSHVCECGKQFSRQDALRRHAQYGRCPNRGPVPSQLANVKVGVLPPATGVDEDLLQQADSVVADESETGVAMDVTADGESHAPPPNNDEEDQLAEDDAAGQGSKAAGKSRPRRSTAPKKEKEKTEPAAPKAKGTKKKRKRSSFARPVDDGDSELDEDEDGIVQQPPPPPPAPARKTKKQRKSPQPKVPPPAPVKADTPEEEDELIDSYEEEDPNHAPSSFQFALPGVHSKEEIKASESKKRVQPRRGRGVADAIVTETEAVVEIPSTESQSQTEETYDQVSIQPPSFVSTSTDTDNTSGDKYASIIERMNRTPFGIEAEVMKATFPLGLVRNVGGQGVASEALQRQQADQDVTMSDWVQDQDSDADMSDENGGTTKKVVEPAPPTTQAAVIAVPQEPSKVVAAHDEESSEPESDGPEEEDVAAALGVEKASPIKETPPAVAAS